MTPNGAHPSDPPPQGEDAEGFAAARDQLLAALQAEARATGDLTGRPLLAPRVVEALRAVPREAFVAPEDADRAYENRPLAIGRGQTISQPFVVALMTELLDLAEHDRVLEIGTGSGYQTAVLARLAREVYTIERIHELAQRARTRFVALGLTNVTLREADGRAGWPEAAPFDAILMTAAASGMPPALLEQLGPGGRLVAPIGDELGGQILVRLERSAEGQLTRRAILPVAFVPLLPGTA